MGVGWVMGESGQPEVGYAFHWDTDSSAVSSTNDKTDTVHSPQDDHWQQLAPYASLLKPRSGSTGPAVHPCRLTGSAKSPL